MELAESDEEDDSATGDQDKMEFEELVNLPSEWIDLKEPEAMEEDQTLPADLLQSSQEIAKETNQGETPEQLMFQQEVNKEQEEELKKPKKPVKSNSDTIKKWDPVLVEGRTRRQAQGGKSMLERAQELKMKQNLEVPKGKNINSNAFSVLSDSEFNLISSAVDISLGMDEASGKNSISELMSLDSERNRTFPESCVASSCSDNCVLGDNIVDNRFHDVRIQGVALVRESGKCTGQRDQEATLNRSDESWTLVSNRSSNKKVQNDMSLLEY